MDKLLISAGQYLPNFSPKTIDQYLYALTCLLCGHRPSRISYQHDSVKILTSKRACDRQIKIRKDPVLFESRSNVDSGAFSSDFIFIQDQRTPKDQLYIRCVHEEALFSFSFLCAVAML